jgi:hypothetical protein
LDCQGADEEEAVPPGRRHIHKRAAILRREPHENTIVIDSE